MKKCIHENIKKLNYDKVIIETIDDTKMKCLQCQFITDLSSAVLNSIMKNQENYMNSDIEY